MDDLFIYNINSIERNQVNYIKRLLFFLNKHKVFFCLLIFMPLYHWLVVNNAKVFGVNEVVYPFFAVDYSMGFCEKFFVGELFHLLVGKYSLNAASAFVGVFYLLFIILLAYLAEKFVFAFPQNKRVSLVFLALFLSGPFSVGIFVKEFGMLDFFWAFLFFAAIACLNNKYLKFFVPVFAVLMILVHYGSLICYVAALLLIIFFYALKADSKSERILYIVILALSAVLSVGLTLYFVKNNANNLTYSLEQFRHIVQDERHANPFYYEFNFYKTLPPELYSSQITQKAYASGILGSDLAGTDNVFRLIFAVIKRTVIYLDWKEAVLSLAIALIPQLFLLYIFGGYIKSKKSKIKKLLAIAFILLSIVIESIGILFSTDTPRWACQSVLLLFCFVFILIYFDYKEGLERINQLFLRIGYPIVYIFLFFYSNIILPPYTFSFF